MPLVSVNELLNHATKNKYGIAAINVMDFMTIRHAVMAAQQERVGIIIQYYPGYSDFCPLSHIAFMAKDLAAKATVPVAVHLDHSATYEVAISGLRDGFPSIMVDGSVLPYEENVKLTSAVVDAAKVFHVDVEAELGHVGFGDSLEDFTNQDQFTQVDQAVDFIQRTGCLSLAVAVGNAHGNYAQKPNLDFERIKALRRAIEIPLVLHGCSGIPDDQMQRAVNEGMSKFNIATEYSRATYRGLQQLIESGTNKDDCFALFRAAQVPMMEFVVKKIRLLNPNRFAIG